MRKRYKGIEVMNQEDDEKSRKRLDEEVKNKRNILINRIVSITILSIALLLGFWGIWKYKSTTNKMEAELIEKDGLLPIN